MRIKIRLPSGGNFPLGWSDSDGHVTLAPGVELLALPVCSGGRPDVVSFFRAEVLVPGTDRLVAIEVLSRYVEIVH